MTKLQFAGGQLTNLASPDSRPYVDLTQYAVMTPPNGNGEALNTLQDIYAGVYKAPQSPDPSPCQQESFPCWKDAVAAMQTKDYDSDGSEGERYRDEVDMLADPYESAQYFTGSDLSR